MVSSILQKGWRQNLSWLLQVKDLLVYWTTKAPAKIISRRQTRRWRLAGRRLKLSDVIDVIKSKPPELDLVLTGNHASKEVIELADLVTEMKEIKHPFKSGIKAKKGIDF